MARYVIVETRNPLEGGDYAFELGKQLRELRHDVTIYLLQDAVFTARKTFTAGADLVAQAERDGVRLLADQISLRQRGVAGDRIAKGVSLGDMPELVDLLMERSDKTIWH
jgi:predicted peroxiredoxin